MICKLAGMLFKGAVEIIVSLGPMSGPILCTAYMSKLRVGLEQPIADETV